MNQEILENATFADGKTLPTATTKNEIEAIPWNNLIGYYPMSRFVFGSVKDESNSGNDASMINYDLLDEQTAPLPYQTTQNGYWDDTTTWVNGNVQYLPGVNSYLDGDETINYNIVQIDHDITIENKDTALIPAANGDNRTVLGLIINVSGDLEIVGDNATDTGNAITVSHYLKIDGTIDLEGESQLIQTTDSDLDATSSGTLERDQQGTADLYTYNYWSAPVGVSNASTNNNSYTLPDVMNDGTNAASLSAINWLTSGYNGSNGDPISLADYWVWKYVNQLSDDYASWQHVRSTGSLQAGEGFTMKGAADTGGAITTEQNYIFNGKPHNGDITITLSAGNDYLIGNPYASAIDANEFILDNTNDGAGRAATDIIDGTLYFWDHFANASHHLSAYEGGYAIYNLTGGTAAISNDVRINNSGATGTKEPQRYIPIGQGFFVVADNPSGNPVTFKNSQRIFQKEGASSSLFMRVGNNKNQNQNVTGKSNNTDTREKIKIMFDSPTGYHRQLLVGVDQNATNAIDIGYDAPLIESNEEDMYWYFSDKKFIIQGTDHFNNSQILPLGVKIKQSGIATFRIDKLENIDPTKTVLLHDITLDVYHNLGESNYEVTLPSGEYNDRFEITFGVNGALSDSDSEITEMDVHYSNAIKSIIINNPTNLTITKIEVHNILGQSIYSTKSNINDTYKEIKLNGISSGSYIIKLNSLEGVITKKVIIE
jgi:hypothetical protein